MNRGNKKRILAGSILTVLSLILTGDIIAVMTHRIKTVKRPDIYKKNLFGDMLLCTSLIISSLDLFISRVIFQRENSHRKLYQNKEKSEICNRFGNGSGKRETDERPFAPGGNVKKIYN